MSVHPSTGTPRFVRLKRAQRVSLSRRAAATTKAEQDDRSRSFFRENAAAYGLSTAEGSLREVREKSDAFGWKHHVFAQVNRGADLVQSELTIRQGSRSKVIRWDDTSASSDRLRDTWPHGRNA